MRSNFSSAGDGIPFESQPTTTPHADSFDALRSALDVIANAEERIRASAQDPDDIEHIVAECTCTALAASGAAIARRDGDALVCCATSGSPVPPIGAAVPTDSGLTGECLRTGQIVLCDDTEEDLRTDPESCRLLGLRSVVLIPVVEDGHTLGLLEAVSSRPHAFAEFSPEVFERLAGLLRFERSEAPPDPEAFARRRIATIETIWQQTAAPEPRSWRPAMLAGMVLLLIVASAAVWRFRPWEALTNSASAAPAIAAANRSVADSKDFNDLKQRATSGDPAAQFLLGLKYMSGDDAPRDEAEGVSWVTTAANAGNVNAQSLLGTLYLAGRGVDRSYAKSYMWSMIAANGGDSVSRDRLKAMDPLMTPQDIAVAQREVSRWKTAHRIHAARAEKTPSHSAHRKSAPAASSAALSPETSR